MPAKRVRPLGRFVIIGIRGGVRNSGSFFREHANAINACVVGFGNHLRDILKVKIAVTFHIRNFLSAAEENARQMRLQVIPGYA
jgi:hypothetical protein